MYLITGLGNPGDKYAKNRHNVGFLVIDQITKNTPTSNINNSNFKAIVLKTSKQLLVKPQTFMNLSGEAVLSIADYYNIPNDNIIVIHDDLDLPFGSVKFKIGGGHGGHNGLRSIDSHIDKDYIRVRIGIGKPFQSCAIDIRAKHIIIRIQFPNIARAMIWLWWAFFAPQMS